MQLQSMIKSIDKIRKAPKKKKRTDKDGMAPTFINFDEPSISAVDNENQSQFTY